MKTRKRLTVHECIRQNGRDTVWLDKVDGKNHCIEVPTAQAYDVFEMDRIVTKWWYEPDTCLCMLVE